MASQLIKKFNRKLAVLVTSGVGTMACAYLFAFIALISLPNAIRTHDVIVIVSWVAQTFLQLVLLSIIMVGQSINSEKMDQQISETHEASLAEFEIAKMEVAELKKISSEVHQLLKDIESRLPEK
jgi:hypothetical protein